MSLDVISLDEAKDAINQTSVSTTDSELALWITAVSQRFDRLCGPVVKRSVTELHDGGETFIRPRTTPLAEVTTLTEYVSTTGTVLSEETNATKPSNGYLIDAPWTHDVRIRRRGSGGDSLFPWGRNNVELVYNAGRADSTSDVDEVFRLTAGAILRRLWSREQGAWSTGGDPFAEAGGGQMRFHKTVDPMVREFLADEMRPPVVG